MKRLPSAFLALVLGALPSVSWASPACATADVLRIDEVAMGSTSVRWVVLRNLGSTAVSLEGLELALLADLEGPAHVHLGAGRPPVDRFLFPRGATVAPGATYAIALSGAYTYAKATGASADVERPVRGGEPDVPDIRSAASWDRLGAVPEVVALTCVAQAVDLDLVDVTPGRTWSAPPPPPPPAPPESSPTPAPAPDSLPAEDEAPAPVAAPPPPPVAAPTVPPPEGADPPPWTVRTRGWGGLFVRAFTDDDDPATDEVATGPTFHGSAEVTGRVAEARVQVYALAPVQPGSHQAVFTLQDAWLGGVFGPLRLRVGMQTIAWHHMVVVGSTDTLNARFYDGGLEDPRRLGEPTAEAQLALGSWTVRALFLPTYIPTLMPTAASRRNLVPGLAYGPSIFLDPSGRVSADRFGPQGALRVEGPVGPVRLGVHALEHIDRTNFPLVPHPDDGAPSPLHLPVRDVGWTLRLGLGQLTLVSEGVWRDFRSPVDTPWDDVQPPDHVASALGANAGFQAVGLAHLVVAEVQVLTGNRSDVLKGVTPFQRDAVIGYRIAQPNASERALLVGFIVDIEDPGRVYTRVNYHQRVLQAYVLDVDLSHVQAPVGEVFEPVQLEALHGSLQLQVGVTRPF